MAYPGHNAPYNGYGAAQYQQSAYPPQHLQHLHSPQQPQQPQQPQPQQQQQQQQHPQHPPQRYVQDTSRSPMNGYAHNPMQHPQYINQQAYLQQSQYLPQVQVQQYASPNHQYAPAPQVMNAHSHTSPHQQYTPMPQIMNTHASPNLQYAPSPQVANTPQMQPAWHNTQSHQYVQQNNYQQYGNGYQTQPIHASPQTQQHRIPQQYTPQPQHQGLPYAQSPQPTMQQRIPTPVSQKPTPKPVHAPIPAPLLKPPTPVLDRPIDAKALLPYLAEQQFEAAYAISQSTSERMHPDQVARYQKHIATGLGCLESAIKNTKLPPRQEAALILRYAGVLNDESSSNTEAEVALSKGINLCGRNHLFDLKYNMQLLSVRAVFKKNAKSALKMIDRYVADAEAYHHYPWVYAFRLTRATLSMQSGSASDLQAALGNLQKVVDHANRLGDRAISKLASLYEVLVHLRTASVDSVNGVQTAMAAANAYQLEDGCQIPQLIALSHILDLASSLVQVPNADGQRKLSAMQKKMEEVRTDAAWGINDDKIYIPVSWNPSHGQIVSHDTRSILEVDDHGRNFLAISWLPKSHTFAVVYFLAGVCWRVSDTTKADKYFREVLKVLGDDQRKTKTRQGPLRQAFEHIRWRETFSAYSHMYLGFSAAARCDWQVVWEHLQAMQDMQSSPHSSTPKTLVLLAKYLSGVYAQGSGDLDTALEIFQDSKLDISIAKGLPADAASKMQRDLAILANLNALWILQEPSRVDPNYNTTILADLEPLCKTHANLEIKTAFWLTKMFVVTNPPEKQYRIKNYLSTASAGAISTGNVQLTTYFLSIFHHLFWKDTVGDQALKSARSAALQAQKSGNKLWMSVAHGMLSENFNAHGDSAAAAAAWEEAMKNTIEAMPKQ